MTNRDPTKTIKFNMHSPFSHKVPRISKAGFVSPVKSNNNNVNSIFSSSSFSSLPSSTSNSMGGMLMFNSVNNCQIIEPKMDGSAIYKGRTKLQKKLRIN